MNVQLRINEKNLLRNLRHTFSHSSTVISELMQNARRAGATYIAFTRKGEETLCVQDDGNGIRDLQILFSIAESDWSAELTEDEHPFGMGFLAALFAADKVLVSSNGASLYFRTEDLFEQCPIPITRGGTESGTYMELTGDWPASLVDVVRPLAEAFPIDVIVDGSVMPRPFALDQGLAFRDSEIGQIHMPDFDHARDLPSRGRILGTESIALYLQGLPVTCNWHYRVRRETPNVIHLDSSRFMARMPDRDCLIDQTDQVALIRSEVRKRWQQCLREIKETTTPQDFANFYFRSLQMWKCVELLDDVSVLPNSLLYRVTSSPVLPKNWEGMWFTERHTGLPVTQEAVEQGMPLLALPEDVYATTLVEWHYAHLTKTLCVDGLTHLSENHWLRNLDRSLEGNVNMEVVGPGTMDSYSGVWVDLPIQRCDRIVLNGALGEVAMTDTCLFDEAEPGEEAGEDVMLIPANAWNGEDIRQASRFEDDSDYWREDIERQEVQRFANFLLALKAGTGAAVLTAVLQRCDLRAFPSLLGQAYRVVLSDEGQLSVTHDA